MKFNDVLKGLLGTRNRRVAAGVGTAGVLGSLFPFVGKLITDELLGLDDFRRFGKYAGEGDWGKALKSLGAGTFELGSTVIPGGAILKGARGGKLVANASPIGGKVISMIPGLTASAGVNAGGRFLTPAGRTALQAFRVGEAAQIADAANSGLAMFGQPSVPVFSAREVALNRLAQQRQDMINEMIAQQQMQRQLQQYYGGTTL